MLSFKTFFSAKVLHQAPFFSTIFKFKPTKGKVFFAFTILIYCTACRSDRKPSVKNKNYDNLQIADNTLCPPEGSANNEEKADQNRLKNRWPPPSVSDIDPAFGWQNLINQDDDRRRFDTKKAGILRGYVIYVTPQKKESCNCHSNDDASIDFHITLAENADDRDKSHHIIVEITPRLRQIMAEKGIDWSLAHFKSLIGQQIEVQGWLFYDWEHGDAAFNIDPEDIRGKKNWRASCWEIHPITDIKE